MAVLPVPDCACAMTSDPRKKGSEIDQRLVFRMALPLMTGIIARDWMAEGRSKP